MSLFNVVRRSALLAGMLASVGLLAGCSSFAPVYSNDSAVQTSMSLSYAKPNSRLEQVVYQELSLRLGQSTNPTAPLASVVLVPAFSETMLSRTDNPSKSMEVTVTATLTITPRDGSAAPARTFTRRATAQYTRNDQVLADRNAQEEAAERAARAAAESLRLAILAGASR
jgi:hypothetical protein